MQLPKQILQFLRIFIITMQDSNLEPNMVRIPFSPTFAHLTVILYPTPPETKL